MIWFGDATGIRGAIGTFIGAVIDASSTHDSRIGRSRIGWMVWCTMSGRSGSYYLTLDAMTGPMLVRGE